MLWSLLSIGGVAALVTYSYRRLLVLRRLTRWAAPYLARRRPPAPTSAAAGAENWMAGELEEATSELRWQLGQPALVPNGCAKAAFWLGALATLMQAARQLGSADVRDWAAPLVSFLSGCTGALSCAIIGRVAEQEARCLREDWNALIRRSTRDVAT